MQLHEEQEQAGWLNALIVLLVALLAMPFKQGQSHSGLITAGAEKLSSGRMVATEITSQLTSSISSIHQHIIVFIIFSRVLCWSGNTHEHTKPWRQVFCNVVGGMMKTRSSRLLEAENEHY